MTDSTDAIETLERLIEKWRRIAQQHSDDDSLVGEYSHRTCADDLAAVVASLRQTPDPRSIDRAPALVLRNAAEFAVLAAVDTLLTVLLELPNRYADKYTIDRRTAIAAAQTMKVDVIRAVDAAILNYYQPLAAPPASLGIYENPDRVIAQLRAELDSTRGSRDEWRRRALANKFTNRCWPSPGAATQEPKS